MNLCLLLGVGAAEGQEAQQEAPQAQAGAQQAPQNPPAGTGTSSSSNAANTKEFGRRFVIGVMVSVLPFNLIPGKSSTTTNSASTVTTMDSTTGASSRLGYGLTGEFRISNHWAVDVNALYRRIGYQLDSSVTTTTTMILNGVTTSSTSATSSHEDTRARLFDIPFMVRWYTSAKRPNGPRLFVEGGGAYRIATGLRTSIDTTDASGNVTCCTTTPAPANKSTVGMVAGAGLLLIDPLGIHVVPEVRYTRWTDQTFNNMTTRTEQNELEATFSLSF